MVVGAGVLGLAPAALAHELECEKTVNGEAVLELSGYPATLNYSLKIRNTHPSSPSDVLVASDPLLTQLGWTGFSVPFTLAVNGERTETFQVVVDDEKECEELSKKDGTNDKVITNTFTVGWDNGSDVCQARVDCAPGQPPPPPPPGVDGRRMTGGGSVFGTGRNRVTHGFQIRCNEDDPRQNLEVNWQGNRFHLLDMTSAECTDTALDEEMPRAGFDTYVGVGTGRYNGVEGATINFTFTDDGEPGKDDTAHIVIRDASGTVVLDVTGQLRFGNHQAHP